MIVPDEIHRSKRKTLSISVDATGRLIVRAPLRCSEARIIAFIERKADWITVRREKAKLSARYLPKDDLDGFEFSLLGAFCVIRKENVKRVVYKENSKELLIPYEDDGKSVARWLKRKAKVTLSQMVVERAIEMGASYKSVAISSAKTRWGSCSANNTLRFTFRLAYAPKEIIDYVVVHELAHTFHRNHGKAFWRTVEKYCPDWKVKRKWLKDHGYLMEIF